MFGVERVAVFAAVAAPEMVKMKFDFGRGLIRGEGLAVDGPVFLCHCGSAEVGDELGGDVGAVALAYEEGRSKLVKEPLFEGVGQTIVVGVLSFEG